MLSRPKSQITKPIIRLAMHKHIFGHNGHKFTQTYGGMVNKNREVDGLGMHFTANGMNINPWFEKVKKKNA